MFKKQYTVQSIKYRRAISAYVQYVHYAPADSGMSRIGDVTFRSFQWCMTHLIVAYTTIHWNMPLKTGCATKHAVSRVTFHAN